MRSLSLALATIATIGLAGQLAAASDGKSSYAGQQSRPIKALSEDEVAALQNGDGMGLAKAAELNGYPGPRHALDLAHELHLSDTQVRQMTAIRDRMSATARSLGAALIERERALDRLFADREITAERLTTMITAIGDIQARLRAAHLTAHIETRAILGADQVAQYNKLRGYDGPIAVQPDSFGGHSAGHRH